jgi:hypothetical protein
MKGPAGPDVSASAPLSPWERWSERFKRSIPGAIVLGLLAVLGISPQVREALHWFDSADLAVSPLTNATITPLEGYGVMPAVAGSTRTVYRGGCRVRLSLEHNHEGTAPISITAIRLKLLKFRPSVPGAVAEVDADSIFGAGSRKPHVFQIRLLGDSVDRATWLPDPDSAAVTANSDNILDVEGFAFLTLEPPEPEERVLVTVVAETPGEYEITFEIDYRANSKPRRGLRPEGTVAIHAQD